MRTKFQLRSILLTFLASLGTELWMPVLAQTTLTDGLLAYYPFSGNASDQSGNGNDAAVQGAVFTVDRSGDSDRALALDGIDDYASSPSRAYLNLSGTDFTISCWAVVEIDTEWVLLAKSNGRGIEQKWAFGKVPGDPQNGISFHVVDQSGQVFWHASTQVTPEAGIWNHYLVKREGSQYSIYLNSQLVGSQAGPASQLQQLTAEMTIGQIEELGWLNGKIDDIRVYGRALSASEVEDLYHLESGTHVVLIKAVKPSFNNLILTKNYQLEVSSDMNNWTNVGLPFNATSTSMTYPQYWDVDNWDSLYFRLQSVP